MSAAVAVDANAHLPLANGLTLYHGHGCRSTRVILLYLELRAARLAAGLASPPPLKIVLFADWAKFLTTDYDWYLAINPNGKVPTLVDSAASSSGATASASPVVMWDSSAICTYLLEQYDAEHTLFPADAAHRALYHQYAFYLSGTVDNLTASTSPVQRAVDAAAAASGGGPKSKYFESQLDVNKLAWKEVCSPMFEQQLAHHGPFLLGEKVSALDPLLMYNLRALDDKMVELTGASWIEAETMPALHAYKERTKARFSRRLAFTPLTKWSEQELSENGVVWVAAPQ